MITSAIKRTRKRLMSRKALTKPNLLYFLWRYVGNGRRAFLARSASNDPGVRRVAQELTERGIVIGPSATYLSESGRDALAAASALVLDESRRREAEAANGQDAGARKNKDYLVTLVDWKQEHGPDSPLLKLALDKKLLEIVASYLGMWPRLHAIGAWMNVPTENDAKESQLWHRDPEDMSLIKVFIYLVDVDDGRGPFCYIPKTHPFSAGAGKTPEHKDAKRITDEEMRAAFPPETWVNCTGPAGTMILADTVGFHRGGRPMNGNRILITFTYASGLPLTNRPLRVKGRPEWASEGIQSYAL